MAKKERRTVSRWKLRRYIPHDYGEDSTEHQLHPMYHLAGEIAELRMVTLSRL